MNQKSTSGNVGFLPLNHPPLPSQRAIDDASDAERTNELAVSAGSSNRQEIGNVVKCITEALPVVTQTLKDVLTTEDVCLLKIVFREKEGRARGSGVQPDGHSTGKGLKSKEVENASQDQGKQEDSVKKGELYFRDLPMFQMLQAIVAVAILNPPHDYLKTLGLNDYSIKALVKDYRKRISGTNNEFSRSALHSVFKYVISTQALNCKAKTLVRALISACMFHESIPDEQAGNPDNFGEENKNQKVLRFIRNIEVPESLPMDEIKQTVLGFLKEIMRTIKGKLHVISGPLKLAEAEGETIKTSELISELKKLIIRLAGKENLPNNLEDNLLFMWAYGYSREHKRTSKECSLQRKKASMRRLDRFIHESQVFERLRDRLIISALQEMLGDTPEFVTLSTLFETERSEGKTNKVDQNEGKAPKKRRLKTPNSQDEEQAAKKQEKKREKDARENKQQTRQRSNMT